MFEEDKNGSESQAEGQVDRNKENYNPNSVRGRGGAEHVGDGVDRKLYCTGAVLVRAAEQAK